MPGGKLGWNSCQECWFVLVFSALLSASCNKEQVAGKFSQPLFPYPKIRKWEWTLVSFYAAISQGGVWISGLLLEIPCNST